MRLPRRFNKKALLIGVVSVLVLSGATISALAYNGASNRAESQPIAAQVIEPQPIVGSQPAVVETVQPVAPPPAPKAVEAKTTPVVAPTPEQTREVMKGELYALWDRSDADAQMWECFDKLMIGSIGYGDAANVRSKMAHIYKVYASFCSAYVQWYQAGMKSNLYPLYSTDRSKYSW